MRDPVRLLVRIVVMALFLTTPSLVMAEPADEEVDANASTTDAEGEAEEDDEEQEGADLQGLEEITVTATRRAESLQEVPLSIAALSAQTIQDTGLTQFGQIQQFVPNLKIIPVTDTRSTSIRIRGIGSVGTNAGIDPSVGIFIDGVYQGRAGMSVGDLLDVERIEVLRGPQGTLFGKNTAAGAITITTKRPSYDWETFLETVVGNYNTLEFRGSLNIPIIEDRLAARISGYKAMRDGFDTNRFDGSKVNDNNKYGIRGKLAWDITDELVLLISGDYAEQRDKCCVADIITYEGTSQLGTNFDRLRREAYAEDGSNALWNPDAPPPNNREFPIELDIPQPVDPFDRLVGADTTPKNVVEVGGVSADLLWERDEHTLRWLTAYRIYTSDGRWDGDFSIFDAVLSWFAVDFDQVSSELTWTSPSWDKFEAQGGLYFYYSSMNTVDLLGVQRYYMDRNFLMRTQEPDNIRNTNDNTHDMTSVAAYGQGTYRFTDWLALTAGLRVTYEKKSRDLFSSSTWKVGGAAPVGGPDIELHQSRQVTNLQWHLALRYFPVDDVMLYAKVGNGFKSGGFNQVRVNNLPSEFDDEEALAFEIGTKTSWFDRRLTVNLTGFFTDYDDFQAQLFTGSVINVRNAARLYSYGFESEITAMPVEGLLLGFNIGFNIAEYQSFPGAENTIANQVEIVESYKAENGIRDVWTPANFYCADVDCTQDLSGEVLDGAPRWTIAAFMGYDRKVPRFPATWFTRADWAYTSEYYMAQDLDPNLLQQPFHLLNLRAGLRAENELWELTFWVNNVTDAEWMVVGFDVPIMGGFAAMNGPPRQYGGTVRINF